MWCVILGPDLQNILRFNCEHRKASFAMSSSNTNLCTKSYGHKQIMYQATAAWMAIESKHAKQFTPWLLVTVNLHADTLKILLFCRFKRHLHCTVNKSRRCQVFSQIYTILEPFNIIHIRDNSNSDNNVHVRIASNQVKAGIYYYIPR